jgi:hypothetical protein
MNARIPNKGKLFQASNYYLYGTYKRCQRRRCKKEDKTYFCEAYHLLANYFQRSYQGTIEINPLGFYEKTTLFFKFLK